MAEPEATPTESQPLDPLKVMKREKLVNRSQSFEVIGQRPTPRIDDFYLQLLAAPWRYTIGLIVVFLMGQNFVFAFLYWLSNGIDGTRTLTNDFARAFFFSVETLGTIGYGTMYPTNMLAHVLVTIESITGILSIALITGVIFAKFSRIRARVLFSRIACISLVDGVPTLMLRVANERGGYIADASITVTVLCVGKTREGHNLARMQDLKLARDRSPSFTRTWLVMHPITPESPLYGVTPQSFADSRGELIVAFSGVDNVSNQGTHVVESYLDEEVVWGHRFVDMMVLGSSGRGAVDMTKFHTSEELVATDEFPYGKGSAA